MVLRIDDTDAERSERRFERVILQDAEWLGLRFDEGPEIGGAHGPYRQSERGPPHHGRAICCRRTRLPLLLRRGAARAGSPLGRGGRTPWRYDGGCDALRRRVEGGRRLVAGRRPVCGPRARRRCRDQDAARGEVRVPAGTVGDFVLLRSMGTATYNFATAVDDAAMQITHVIRGEDHISNTARQLPSCDALELSRASLRPLRAPARRARTEARQEPRRRVDRRLPQPRLPTRGAGQLRGPLVCSPPEGADEVAMLAT